MDKPRILDLFAGAGGFSLGFHWAGFHTSVAIDHNPFAVETLQGNFSDMGTLALGRDLATFSPTDLERYLVQTGRDPYFDAIIGGPPCQGWSSVGRGQVGCSATQRGAARPRLEQRRSRQDAVAPDSGRTTPGISRSAQPALVALHRLCRALPAACRGYGECTRHVVAQRQERRG